MDIFLSYSAADRKMAARLRKEFEKRGLSVWHEQGHSESPPEWRRKIEEGIRCADNILVLIGARREPDEAQQATWMRAVEAVWEDSRKRLIPILLRDAEPPAFVRSGSRSSLQAVRIAEPGDLSKVVDRIVGVVQSAPEDLSPARPLRSGGSAGRELPEATSPDAPLPKEKSPGSFKMKAAPAGAGSSSSPDSPPVKTGGFTSVSAEDRAQRRARLAEIEQFAERLKSH